LILSRSSFAQTVNDTTAPNPPVVANLTTFDTTPTLTGSAEAGSTVTIIVYAVTYTTTADGSGNWSFTLPTALAKGTYSVTTTATDAAGNKSTATTSSLVIDVTVPEIVEIKLAKLWTQTAWALTLDGYPRLYNGTYQLIIKGDFNNTGERYWVSFSFPTEGLASYRSDAFFNIPFKDDIGFPTPYNDYIIVTDVPIEFHNKSGKVKITNNDGTIIREFDFDFTEKEIVKAVIKGAAAWDYVSGYSRPGSEVSIYSDANKTNLVARTTTNSWTSSEPSNFSSFAFTNLNLIIGNKYYLVTKHDGLESSVEFYAVENPVPKAPSNLSATKTSVIGTGEPGTQINVSATKLGISSYVGGTTVAGDGSFEIVFSEAVPEGTTVVLLASKTINGVVTNANSPVQIKVPQTTAPTILMSSLYRVEGYTFPGFKVISGTDETFADYLGYFNLAFATPKTEAFNGTLYARDDFWYQYQLINKPIDAIRYNTSAANFTSSSYILKGPNNNRTIAVTYEIDELPDNVSDAASTTNIFDYTVTGSTALDNAFTWSLSGLDANEFTISEEGLIKYKGGLNYEEPSDSDENNVYLLTVKATHKENQLFALQDLTLKVKKPSRVEIECDLSRDPKNKFDVQILSDVHNPQCFGSQTNFTVSFTGETTLEIPGATGAQTTLPGVFNAQPIRKRMTFILAAEDLIESGMKAGDVSRLALNLKKPSFTSAAEGLINFFSIRMRLTDNKNFIDGFNGLMDDKWVRVYSGQEFSPKFTKINKQWAPRSFNPTAWKNEDKTSPKFYAPQNTSDNYKSYFSGGYATFSTYTGNEYAVGFDVNKSPWYQYLMADDETNAYTAKAGLNEFILGTGTNASLLRWDGVSNIVVDIYGVGDEGANLLVVGKEMDYNSSNYTTSNSFVENNFPGPYDYTEAPIYNVDKIISKVRPDITLKTDKIDYVAEKVKWYVDGVFKHEGTTYTHTNGWYKELKVEVEFGGCVIVNTYNLRSVKLIDQTKENNVCYNSPFKLQPSDEFISKCSADYLQGDLTYVWTDTETNSVVSNQRALDVIITKTSNFKLKISDSQGNFLEDQVAVTMVGIPAEPNVTFNSLCINSQTTLTISNIVENHTYNWFKLDVDNNRVQINSQSPASVSISEPGTYFAKSINQAGCETFSQPIIVSTTLVPTPSISTNNGDKDFCQGSSFNLTATNIEGVTSFRWYKNNTLIPNQSGSTITVTEPGDYKVESIISQCSSFSELVKIGMYTTDQISLNYLNGGTGVVCGNDKVKFGFSGDSKGQERTFEKNLGYVRIIHPNPYVILLADHLLPYEIASLKSLKINYPYGNLLSYPGGYTVKIDGNVINATFSDKTLDLSSFLPFSKIEIILNNPGTTSYPSANFNPINLSGVIKNYTISWFKDGQIIQGENGLNYETISQGTYKVKLNYNTGCISESEEKSVIVSTDNVSTVPVISTQDPISFCPGTTISTLITSSAN